MTLIYENPDPSKKPTAKPIRWRLVAILIMVVGAVGFFTGLIFFQQQIGCLALSTLITLAGLGLNIYARRKGWLSGDKPAGSVTEARQVNAARWLTRSHAPRGLRRTANSLPTQRPMAVQPSTSKQTVSIEPLPDSLVGRVSAILEAQAAVVTKESLRPDRGILRVITAQGQRYVAMVITPDAPCGVAEVRSLLALVQGSGSTRGYLIASHGFTKDAYEWAEGRSQVRLVGEDELDELGV